MIQDVPELRILEDELWAEVKARQSAIRKKYVSDDSNGLTATRRKRYLFSGLIKCAECGGGYSLVYRDAFGCSTVKNKGTCGNHTHIGREELESRVLTALRDNLMAPERFKEFCEEYTREINRIRIEASSDLFAKRAELKKVEAQIEKMVQAVMDGFYSPSMKEKMPVLEARKAELIRDLEHAEEPPALLHPNMALEYRSRVNGLFVALQDEQTRLEASDDIRALVGRIVVSPGEDDKANLWLEGDLAGILTLAAGRKTPAHPDDERVLTSLGAGTNSKRSQQNEKSRPQGAAGSAAPEVLTSLVAGTGFEPVTFRL
ncbi:MAG: hypothetical protein CMI60_20930 [Parvibaculum sp.]|nr:hypothetical protein [Parvibaculum sp.]